MSFNPQGQSQYFTPKNTFELNARVFNTTLIGIGRRSSTKCWCGPSRMRTATVLVTSTD
ncbi:hypothetical protein AHiyo8_25840 [Arthrobacter sp. Hiyo8]|nr:hypothetical protein AHiyo8_25840 [Arthrobacter sp. Hiyo8]